MTNRRLERFEQFSDHPFYGPVIEKLPFSARLFIVSTLGNFGHLCDEEYVSLIRGLYLKQGVWNANVWATMEELFMIANSKEKQ